MNGCTAPQGPERSKEAWAQSIITPESSQSLDEQGARHANHMFKICLSSDEVGELTSRGHVYIKGKNSITGTEATLRFYNFVLKFML